MDLDLSTNGASIKENILKLNSGKISWMILGYSENCTLNVIETGDNSLEDMFDEFQGSEIMYGFASVIDPNTKLKKNIYIHWQGAGSKQVMKTKSVQHSNVIRELCKPIHVTLNARDSQDLDLKEVMQKVASASGANYSFHTEKQQIFETKPVIKSQSNSANAAREERQRELASIGGMKKEISTHQKVNSSQISVKPGIKPPMNITQNYSKDTSYKKINPEKEFKSLPQNQKSTFETPARIQSENNTAEKAREERQKELSKLVNRVYVDEPFQQVGTNYTKINPLAELQQFKRQSSISSEESKTPSEFSKVTKNSFVEEPIQQVGTNYTKINPMAEIQQLRRQSSSTDSEIPKNTTTSSYIKCTPREEIIKLRKESVTEDDGTQVLSNSYKKIDPLSEIQQLRRSHKFDIEENVTPSSVYKKINPVEEMKNFKLKSDSNFNEPSSPGSNYKKVNPAEEIMSAKTISESFRNAGVTSSSKKMVPTEEIMSVRNNPSSLSNSEKKSFQQLNSTSEQKSARSSFEQMNKVKQDTHKSSTTVRNSPQSTTPDFKKSSKTETEIPDKKVESDNKVLNLEFHNQPVSPKKVENSKESKSAVALYDYEAIDSDEIGFLMDDIITDIEIIDEGWWIGCTKNGRKGMFPSNYVQIITTDKEPDIEKHNDNSTTMMNPIENKIADSLTVVAIYDYESLQDDEISFKEGDYIYNVDQFDEGWWSGENKDGAKGMFPSNYVKFL